MPCTSLLTKGLPAVARVARNRSGCRLGPGQLCTPPGNYAHHRTIMWAHGGYTGGTRGCPVHGSTIPVKTHGSR
eukprot:5534685-Pyramimonas_sp.AAC.1